MCIRDSRDADLIELPGVGAVRDAIGNLEKFDLIPLLEEQVKAGKFFMGVCLGMQLLFEQSFEGGTYKGLGFLPGDIVPFHTKDVYKRQAPFSWRRFGKSVKI